MSFTKTAGGTDYGNPFIGPIDYTDGVNVVIANLTTREVDSNGVLKPGVPFRSTGALVSGTSQVIYGCVAEATKVAAGNDATSLTAAGTQQISLVIRGALNSDMMTDILGSALTANEIAAFAAAGSHIILIA
jgi:hypothetical protein